MKPKKNYVTSDKDLCQTPDYALDPLLPYIKKINKNSSIWTIWECASGEGNIVKVLQSQGYKVIGTDILEGVDFDFFDYQPYIWDCIITNPPYRLKYQWLERCYQLNKPFALLMPLETLGAKRAQVLFEKHGFEIILLRPRVNFKMPKKGYDGKGAQFPTAWFTWKFDIGQQITFAELIRRTQV